MARPQKLHCCPHCGEVVDFVASIGEKREAIVRALSTGPKKLSELAAGVYGVDTARNRRRASSLIKRSLRPDVEPVDGKGTWRLAQSRAAE